MIRQERQTDGYGNFVKKEPPARRYPAGSVMKSAFDDTEFYVLTDLGAKFVHYVMEDVAPQLDANTSSENQIGLGTFLRGLAGEIDFPRLRLEPAASACASNPMPRTEGRQARRSVRKQ